MSESNNIKNSELCRKEGVIATLLVEVASAKKDLQGIKNFVYGVDGSRGVDTRLYDLERGMLDLDEKLTEMSDNLKLLNIRLNEASEKISSVIKFGNLLYKLGWIFLAGIVANFIKLAFELI